MYNTKEELDYSTRSLREKYKDVYFIFIALYNLVIILVCVMEVLPRAARLAEEGAPASRVGAGESTQSGYVAKIQITMILYFYTILY